MAITTYSELQTRLPDWIERNDLSTLQIQEYIQLAEARLNRQLRVVETEAALTGTSGSRAISIEALSLVEPMHLKIIDPTTRDEREILLKPDGVMDYLETSSCPAFYEINGTNIKFNCPLDQAYTFRFVYLGRFALSDTAPTNKLLTEHPDVYLAAVIVWNSLLVEDDPRLSKYKSVLEEGIAEVRHTLAQSDRAVLTPDPMFSATSRGSVVDGRGWWY